MVDWVTAHKASKIFPRLNNDSGHSCGEMVTIWGRLGDCTEYFKFSPRWNYDSGHLNGEIMRGVG